MEIVESTVKIVQELNIAHKTVCNHLNKAGYKKKLDIWLSLESTQKNLMDQISICESKLNRYTLRYISMNIYELITLYFIASFSFFCILYACGGYFKILLPSSIFYRLAHGHSNMLYKNILVMYI